MVNQLKLAYPNVEYHEDEIKSIEDKDAMSFYKTDLAAWKWSVEYHQKEQDKDKEMNKNSNEWIRQLKASLAK